ncbi:hypothetical protein T08_5482 [Trichinella sp. T8]|nr:hypothetical protein T08_5482 [Trichinella sp. T8]
MSELSLTIITSFVYPFCTTFQFLLHKSSIKNFLDSRNVRELLDWISLGYLHQVSVGNCALSFPETGPGAAWSDSSLSLFKKPKDSVLVQELLEHEQFSYLETPPLMYAANSIYHEDIISASCISSAKLLLETAVTDRVHYILHNTVAIPNGLSKGTCSRSDPKDATSPADTSRRPTAGRDSVVFAKSQQDSYQVGLEVRSASSWLISNTLLYFADLKNTT